MDNNPKQYTFAELFIGQTEKFSVKITSDLLENFANLSGDFNPLHMNDDYAKKTKFGQRIGHGMLLSSFLSRLIGMHLPGENALYISQNLNFELPCFINDTVTIIGEIIDKSSATKIITIKTTIYNQSNHCLVSGTAKVILRE